MASLYQRLTKKGLAFSHVCEVGVFEPATSNVLGFIEDHIRATLVEADPAIASRIEDYFSKYDVVVHPVAVWDHAGRQKLARASASTFVVDLMLSPTLANDNYRIDEDNTFEVDSIVFSSIDDGTIDLLSIDIEGGEWYVLKHLVSRPRIISVETHGKNYVNPFMPEIEAWMKQHGYRVWYKDNTDSVYTQSGVVKLTLSDDAALRLKNFSVALRRRKGKLLKQLGLR